MLGCSPVSPWGHATAGASGGAGGKLRHTSWCFGAEFSSPFMKARLKVLARAEPQLGSSATPEELRLVFKIRPTWF